MSRVKASRACRIARLASEVPRARCWARKTLADWGLQDQVELVELVVSELVTNALRYGSAGIEARLVHTDQDLWFEVHDEAEEHPVRRRVDPERATNGRGLQLVDALVRAQGGVWGVSHDARPGKVVFVAMPTGCV